jgi:hypothetical protein
LFNQPKLGKTHQVGVGSRGRQLSLRRQILERHGLQVVGECYQQAAADLDGLHGSLFFFSSVEVLFVQVISMLFGAGQVYLTVLNSNPLN